MNQIPRTFEKDGRAVHLTISTHPDGDDLRTIGVSDDAGLGKYDSRVVLESSLHGFPSGKYAEMYREFTRRRFVLKNDLPISSCRQVPDGPCQRGAFLKGFRARVDFERTPDSPRRRRHRNAYINDGATWEAGLHRCWNAGWDCRFLEALNTHIASIPDGPQNEEEARCDARTRFRDSS